MHYFQSWTPEIVLNMSWNNFMLYMAAISSESEEDAPENKRPESKNAADVF